MEILQYLQSSPIVFFSTVILFSLCIGSFLNVVIHRLPKMLETSWRSQCCEHLNLPTETTPKYNLFTPRSQCPHCQHQIKAWENIPLISYLFLKGKCAGCAAAISPRYPIIEFITALASFYVAWHFGFGLATVAALLFTWILVALVMIDFDHQLLPDNLTLPGLWLGLFFSLFNTFVPPHEAIIGALAGYLSLWSFAALFKLFTGKDGMGYGDFKLFAMLGAWLGYQMLPLIILLSSIVGAVVGISLILIQGRDRHQPIPFGPYLAAAGWIALLWGPNIIAFYTRFLLL